jgi:hypothetical protein
MHQFMLRPQRIKNIPVFPYIYIYIVQVKELKEFFKFLDSEYKYS